MAGRLAVDFGTSNTVVALWDETTGQGRSLRVPDYGRLFVQGEELAPVVPSVIHYAPDGRRLIGDQVSQRGVAAAAGTFRWMKRYVANRSPVRLRVGDRQVSHFDAGRDFLAAVLGVAVLEAGVEKHEEVALTVPVDCYEHYAEWLSEVAEAVGVDRCRLIDEPSAAALGCGANTKAGDVHVVVDFGGGTLDVAVVRFEEDDDLGQRQPPRVLGKAAADLGGSTIDQWLFEEVLSAEGRRDTDEGIRRLSAALLAECEAAKERLSWAPRAEASVQDPSTGAVVGMELTRERFEAVLDEREAFTVLNQTVLRALGAARERGYDEDDVTAVLMVGGSSLIPSVQRAVQRIFGRAKVRVDRPLDAVARGAAFAAGVDIVDHVQHDYAIRWLNRQTGKHEYRTCVRRGTTYPTAEALVRLNVSASHDGQTQLGLAMFELGDLRRAANGSKTELVMAPDGRWRTMAVSRDEEDERTHFWLNEGVRPSSAPTLPPLSASPGSSSSWASTPTGGCCSHHVTC